MNDNVGDLFQQKTKYVRGSLSTGPLLWHLKPETYKFYQNAPKIALDPISNLDGLPLWQVIKERKSLRNFSKNPISKTALSRLLWATQGITRRTSGFEFRTAPSAGALYPVETYVIIHSVEAIPSGVYHYSVISHELELIKKGDFREEITHAALDQDMAYTANLVFVWTAIFERSKWKYKQRAYRYVYLDAGHIAQNLALAAVGLNLGSCQIAAFYDEEANELLGLDGINESVLYMTVVGSPL
ncbi:MAG: SagB/ThcOx family dehydrogenase [Candidatus Aminicenantes bacterium]|nr:SagB/ThcOx family dehydrogenase [Candidatus Aminicenantes bacterium]